MAFGEFRRSNNQRNTAPLLTPEEENALLNYLGATATGGLAAVGTVLGTPGAFFTTALAGEDPFAGIFDPAQRIGGRGMLESWGWLDENREGFQPIDDPLDALGDVLGFAADVAVDPLTYTGLGVIGKYGALNAAGKASLAGKAGAKALPTAIRGQGLKLEKGIRQQLIEEGLGGLARVEVPFTDIGFDVGTGPLSQKIAGGIDQLGETLRYGSIPFTERITEGGLSPGRLAGAVFSKANKNTYQKASQIAAQEMHRLEGIAGEEAASQSIKFYQDLESEFGLPADTMTRLLDKAAEGGVLDPSEVALLGGKQPAFDAIVSQMHAAKNDAYFDLKDTGRYLPFFNDIGLDHFPRYLSDKLAMDMPGKRIFAHLFDSAKHRADELRDLPRTVIERMMRDPVLVGKSVKMSAPDLDTYIKAGYFPGRDFTLLQQSRDDLQLLVNDAAMGNVTPLQAWVATAMGGATPVGGTLADLMGVANRQLNEFDRLLAQPSELAKRFRRLKPGALGQRMYNDPQKDLARYLRQAKQAKVASEGIADFLAKNVGIDGTPLTDVLRSAGFANDNGTLTDTIRQIMAGKLGYSGPPGDELKFLKAYAVPEEIAADVTRMINGFALPEAVRPAVDALDWFTDAFKLGVTSPWPSFHVRNMLTGVWQNIVGGAMDLKEYDNARLLLAGEVPQGIASHPLAVAKGITDDDEAASFLRGQIYAHNVAGQRFTNELTGRYAPPSENFAGNILGEEGAEISLRGEHGLVNAAREGYREGVKLAGPGTSIRDKLSQKTRGVFGGIVGAGRHAGDLVEGLNRASAFLALTKKGVGVSEAAAKTRALHVDFANLSDTERAIFRRLIPFYSWSRGMIPEVLTELVEHPGGITGQSAQLAAQAREGQDAFLPEHLQGGLGLPIGTEDELGRQSFLTALDLPAESVFEMLHTGPNWMSQTGLDVLGQLNPAVKAPLEVMTGKQFFSGRELRDLYSPTGSILLDQGLMNSPLAKGTYVVRQLNQLREGRKTLPETVANLTTGAKVATIDMPKQRSIAAREQIEERLRGQKGVNLFEHMYLDAEGQANLTPEDAELFTLYRVLSNRAQKEARERKKEKAANERIGLAR